MPLNGRSKPLGRWIVRPAAGSGHGVEPMGIVVTNGRDESLALLTAAKRWRFSQAQLVAMWWDDCDPHTRLAGALAEQAEAAQLVADCRALTLGERDVTPGWRTAIGHRQP